MQTPVLPRRNAASHRASGRHIEKSSVHPQTEVDQPQLDAQLLQAYRKRGRATLHTHHLSWARLHDMVPVACSSLGARRQNSFALSLAPHHLPWASLLRPKPETLQTVSNLHVVTHTVRTFCSLTQEHGKQHVAAETPRTGKSCVNLHCAYKDTRQLEIPRVPQVPHRPSLCAGSRLVVDSSCLFSMRLLVRAQSIVPVNLRASFVWA